MAGSARRGRLGRRAAVWLALAVASVCVLGCSRTPATPVDPAARAQQLIESGNVAYRQGDYLVTASLGPKTTSTVVHVGERNVRRTVTVVARVPRTLFPTSEVWIHPNGRVAYLGTHGGGDRVYAIDISNPASPVIVDSIMANTRLVNDMITTADGNYMVFTREGAADRKNGIVIADTKDPLHPKEIAYFNRPQTQGTTPGGAPRGA